MLNFNLRFSFPSSLCRQGSTYLRQSKDEWLCLKVDEPTDVGSIVIKKSLTVKSDSIDLLLRHKSNFLSLRDIVILAFCSVTNLKLLRSNDRAWGIVPHVQDWEPVGSGQTQMEEIKVNDLQSP